MRFFRWTSTCRVVLMAGLGAGLALTLAQSAGAELTGGPDIIAAPSSVADSSVAGGASNNHQQAFNEKQAVPLLAPIFVDGGVIPAGTGVNSHMIFLNQPDCVGPCPSLSDLNETWTFNGNILGVMSDTGGLLEAASNPVLGAPGTFYPGAFPDRGLETNDSYAFPLANAITVNMHVTQPGDWIRVVTEATADDCKKGGWRSSGQWKNQGDCVSWFATHGKNEPGQNVPTSKEP